MSFDFQRIKHVDEEDEMFVLVFGYIKKMEAIHCGQISVPDSIKMLCLSFYYYEYFQECSKNARINRNRNCMTHIRFGKKNRSYGSITIPSNTTNTHEWIFKICSKGGVVWIGIDEYSKRWINDRFYAQTETINYSINTNGIKYSSGERMISSGYFNGGYEEVCMTLNLKSQTLTFKSGTDPNSRGIVHEMIQKDHNIKYKMSIYTCNNKKTSVTLLSYVNYHD
eukprot:304048_1